MRGFVFPLGSVLKLRRVREDRARQSFVRAALRREDHERALQQLGTMRDLTASQLRRAVAEGDTGLLAALGARMRRLDQYVHQGRQVLKDLQAAEAHHKSQLQAAARERKVVERLRERQETAFHTEQQRREASQTDELATMRHSRPGPGVTRPSARSEADRSGHSTES